MHLGSVSIRETQLTCFQSSFFVHFAIMVKNDYLPQYANELMGPRLRKIQDSFLSRATRPISHCIGRSVGLSVQGSKWPDKEEHRSVQRLSILRIFVAHSHMRLPVPPKKEEEEEIE